MSLKSIKRFNSVNSQLFQVIWDNFLDLRNRMCRHLKLEEINCLQKKIEKRDVQVVWNNGKFLLPNLKMCRNLCKNVLKLRCSRDLPWGNKHIPKSWILNLIKRHRVKLCTQLGDQQKIPPLQAPITTQQWKLEFQPVFPQS